MYNTYRLTRFTKKTNILFTGVVFVVNISVGMFWQMQMLVFFLLQKHGKCKFFNLWGNCEQIYCLPSSRSCSCMCIYLCTITLLMKTCLHKYTHAQRNLEWHWQVAFTRWISDSNQCVLERPCIVNLNSRKLQLSCQRAGDCMYKTSI